MPETDPIHFDGYLKKIETLKEKTKIQEAVTTGFGEIHGNKVVIAVMDGNFLMGSMGSVVGEKITLAIRCNKRKITIYNFLCVWWS